MHDAIVIGGSMAGLLAARVLADHFERVTIVDRDRFPAIGEQRRGVPQGRHTHGLLASGRRVLDELFPGISDTLIAAGALDGDVDNDSRWFFEGGCLAKGPSELWGVLVSRPRLEGVVRDRVLALPNVTALQERTVEGLMAIGGRVTGIKLSDAETLTADLVIDATGRGSHAPRWLEANGYPKPREERVEIALGYATRLFRRCATDLNGDTAIVIPPTPSGKRGGVMLAQEGDRWTVTLISHFGNYPPPELDGFIEFSKTLPAPYIYEVIRAAEPLCDGAVTHFPASIRHHYEKLKKFPEGYLVIGDAISSFNPIYGQGMSSAALQAMELRRTLASGLTNLAQRFFRRAGKVVDSPWNIAVGNDLRMPETTGPRSIRVNFLNWYLSRLHQIGHHDQLVALAFLRVANLVAPPPSVMHPRIVMRLIKGSLFGSKKSDPATNTTCGAFAKRADRSLGDGLADSPFTTIVAAKPLFATTCPGVQGEFLMSTERGLSHSVMEGQGAYNRHARLPADGAALALPVLERAIRDLELGSGGEPIVIADYGSSQGKNSLVPMQTAIRGLRKRIGPDRAISVFHIDQPSNDFNSLFEVLDADPNRYAADEAEVYPAAIGKSFYETVLPPGSVHLGWSSYAAVWLSRAPASIPGHFISIRSTGTVRAEFERQAAQDWEAFLTLRSRELRSGGRLVVVLPGVADDGLFGFETIFDHANGVLAEMVTDGAITYDERSRMVLSAHARRKRDLLAPFGRDGKFQQLTVEEFAMSEVPDPAWDEYVRDRDEESLASKRALFFRSIFVPSLACALNPARTGNGTAHGSFADQLEQRLKRRLASQPAPIHSFAQTLLLAKRE